MNYISKFILSIAFFVMATHAMEQDKFTLGRIGKLSLQQRNNYQQKRSAREQEYTRRRIERLRRSGKENNGDVHNVQNNMEDICSKLSTVNIQPNSITAPAQNSKSQDADDLIEELQGSSEEANRAILAIRKIHKNN